MAKGRLVAKQERAASVKELIDTAHASGALLEDVVSVFVSLLVLRLMNEQDQEKRAIAEFDGIPCEPVLPEDALFDHLVSQPADSSRPLFI